MIGHNMAMHPLLPSWLRQRFISFFWLFLLLPAAAPAQDTASSLHSALDHFLEAQTRGLPGKVNYKVTPLDARTNLGPCHAFEPFLPGNSRLWGKSTVGVRCLGPSNWTIYVQVHVSVTGNYLASSRPMASGQVIGAGDLTLRNGDLTTLPATLLTDQTQAIGKTVRLGFAAGQPIRSDQLISPPAVQQGQTVRTIFKGDGFSVSSEGKALNNASDGQVVQVRTPSGQVLSGIARDGGTVEVSY